MLARSLARSRLFPPTSTHHFSLQEITPLIYTPTVGAACQQYSHIYPFLAPVGQPDGLYINTADLASLPEALADYRAAMPDFELDPQIAVITDGSRILGLGDLGMNGMGIPVGKLQLYVAAAGLDPMRTLPVCVDMGTDNEELLADPLYLGLRQHRPSEEEVGTRAFYSTSASACLYLPLSLPISISVLASPTPLANGRVAHACLVYENHGRGA